MPQMTQSQGARGQFTVTLPYAFIPNTAASLHSGQHVSSNSVPSNMPFLALGMALTPKARTSVLKHFWYPKAEIAAFS